MWLGLGVVGGRVAAMVWCVVSGKNIAWFFGWSFGLVRQVIWVVVVFVVMVLCDAGGLRELEGAMRRG